MAEPNPLTGASAGEAVSVVTYTLEAFLRGEWREFGYDNLTPADANFYSGTLNRSTNSLVRARRDSDGEIFCGRVPA